MKKQVHAVGVIFEDDSGEILVLKRHKNSPEAETWGLVGGNIDSGEDGIEAAIRETEEEVAHSIRESRLEFIRAYKWDREDKTIIFEVYSYKVSKSEVEVVLDKEEVTEHMWEKPELLHKRSDLMIGLYPILDDYLSLSGNS